MKLIYKKTALLSDVSHSNWWSRSKVKTKVQPKGKVITIIEKGTEKKEVSETVKTNN